MSETSDADTKILGLRKSDTETWHRNCFVLKYDTDTKNVGVRAKSTMKAEICTK